MGVDDGLPQLAFGSSAEWEAWLEEHHAVAAGVWILVAKKGSGIESVRIPEALDELRFLQRYTPRRRRSNWSRINREKVERLTAEGRMRAAGLAEVERAKADGRWDAAHESQRSRTRSGRSPGRGGSRSTSRRSRTKEHEPRRSGHGQGARPGR